MFPGVPFIFDYLRRAGDAAAPLSGIRLVVTAGAPIDFETLEYFKDRFGVKIHSLYGTTETGSITFDASETLSDRVSVGWPMPETTVTLTPSADLESGGRDPGSRVGRVPRLRVRRRRRRVVPGVHARRFPHRGPGQVGGRWTTDAGRPRLGFVNVAGRKVNPGEVERVIAELPDVVAGLGHGRRRRRARAGARRLRVAPERRALGGVDPDALRGDAVAVQGAAADRLC